ncbi:MAG: GNAT family N-acetyltransferase [Candidatus Eremiobacterota bacterium]
MNNIEYRKIKGIEECKLCEELQLTVWGFSEREVFPSRHLLTAQQNGGLVIGAFCDTGKLVGFSYGFLGYSEGKYYLYSHMLGVLDEYKYKNIGYNLKLLQRKIIQERGFSLIKWTFDPLESPNAYLNLHKLGAVIKTYYIDYYGEFRGINYGLPTDRFLVEWELNTNRVAERVEKQNISPVNPSDYPVITETFYNEKGLLELKKVELNFTEKKFFVEIPSNIQEIKSLDFKAAIDWRNKTRDIFTSYLTGKYCITDFRTFSHDKKLRKSFYLLERY